MKVAVLGTGMVGQAIATRLVDVGHEVCMGSRSADHEGAAAWAQAQGEAASHGSYEEAAGFGEAVFNCTAGSGSLAALEAAGDENLAGKLLVDVANPLDFSGDAGPRLSVANDDSLGEQIQRAHPDARVVKSLNTMNCDLMVDPGLVEGEHVAFVCGDDAAAKREATSLLGEFGWPAERIVDLGPLAAARATEMYLPLWLRLMGATGTARFNLAIARAADQVSARPIA